MTNCDGDGTKFRDETVDDTSEVGASVGTSPYASGGGGFTFERKVAVQYLAHILLGDGAFEFGEGRHAVCLAFQQAPEYPVDDLLIYAARPEENEPSLELALGVRRSPNLVLSDDSTRKFIRQTQWSRKTPVHLGRRFRSCRVGRTNRQGGDRFGPS